MDSTILSLHQEQAATGSSKRKQTPNSGATPPADSDSSIIPTDDEAFMESIKTDLLCSLRKKKKTMKINTVKEKLQVPEGFLALLPPVSRPEQDEVVAPPQTCDLLRRRDVDDKDNDKDDDKDYNGNSSTPSRVRLTNKPKRRRSQSKGTNIRTARTPQPLNTAERNVDALQKVVLQRAENLRSSLKPGLLTFLKPMSRSYVSGDIVRLPMIFCKKHLPDEDATVLLEDENMNFFETKYLSSRGVLSSGWRDFSKANKLVQGDVLVFQQISQTNYKVYIVRSNLPAEVDAAKSASAGAEKNLVSNSIESTTTSAVDFKKVRSIEDFAIVIDGSVLNDDSEIPSSVKTKYYELCRSQRRYLHQNLVKGLNRKLAAGIITEVVNIAYAIKANSKMSRDIFSEWVKTLSGFKNMGMEVGFLLDWVQKLKDIEEKSEMRIKNARMKRDCAEKEKIELVAKLKVVSEALDQYNGEVKKLEKMREFMLNQVGNVPW